MRTTGVIASVLALLLGGLAGSSSGAPVPVSSGKMRITPNTVSAGSTSDFTFTFSADRSAFKGTTTVDFATGWTAPQRGDSTAPGYVEFQRGTCAAATMLVSLKARRLTIATSCKRGQSYTLVYHKATAPTTAADGYIFLTRTRQAAGGKKAELLALGRKKQPIVKVRGGPVVALAMTVTTIATAGVDFGVTVRGIDVYGNNGYPYSATASLTTSDPAATVPGPYTFMTGDGAQHTFPGMTLRTPGTQTITATTSDGLKVTSPPITVSPFAG
ncbi:MAG: hypothetical protein ACXVRE_01695 [Gaiellaceae bacterium]